MSDGNKPKSVEIVKDLEGAPTEDLEQARAELERLIQETTDWFFLHHQRSKNWAGFHAAERRFREHQMMGAPITYNDALGLIGARMIGLACIGSILSERRRGDN